MGRYTDRLFKRRKPVSASEMNQTPRAEEHLVEVAIMLAGGEVVHGFRAHYELRHSLGWVNPTETRPGTRDGFWTNTGRFLTRVEAKQLALSNGQLAYNMHREMLSSDVRW